MVGVAIRCVSIIVEPDFDFFENEEGKEGPAGENRRSV